MLVRPLRSLGLLALAATGTLSIPFDPTSEDSIKSAAATVAANMMHYYTGSNPGDNPGNLPPPYYWWEAGAMFGHMVEYWYYTGDTTYNWQVRQAITWQSGSNGRFEPVNQTADEGNDDQIFWAFAAMSAAELNFEQPLQNESVPSYVAMAQTVLYRQNERWDTTRCGGGLRWQISPIKTGYTYKNSVANGGFFQLAARLARDTGNNSYVDIAERSWDWFSNSGLYNATDFVVNDGGQMDTDCRPGNPDQWSYNYGLWLCGLAYMYNYTKDEKWLPPLKGILQHFLDYFFMDRKIFSEVRCEPNHSCGTDNLIFKSFSMRWMIQMIQLVPDLKDQITPYFDASAVGAAGQCSGPGNECGYNWRTTTWDGSQGVGQQACALAAIQGSMYKVKDLQLPFTLVTGGQSQADPNAGTQGGPGPTLLPPIYTRDITAGDKAGAGILTAVCVILTFIGTYGILVLETSN